MRVHFVVFISGSEEPGLTTAHKPNYIVLQNSEKIIVTSVGAFKWSCWCRGRCLIGSWGCVENLRISVAGENIFLLIHASGFLKLGFKSCPKDEETQVWVWLFLLNFDSFHQKYTCQLKWHLVRFLPQIFSDKQSGLTNLHRRRSILGWSGRLPFSRLTGLAHETQLNYTSFIGLKWV